MPWMTQDEENSLNKPWKCPKCKKPVNRHYCRKCDEFYFTCGCKRDEEHRSCEGGVSDRSYRY